MNRFELEAYIAETYNAEKDCPWIKYPNYEVFRHNNNQKWFAVIMDVPKEKLGLQGDSLLDVVNLNCDSITIGSLRSESGFFPAYHMNKENWLTLALDGSIKDDQLKWLLDQSFELTASKKKQK